MGSLKLDIRGERRLEFALMVTHQFNGIGSIPIDINKGLCNS